MLYIYTLFDRSKYYRPLISAISSGNSDKITFLPMYLRGTGLSVYQAEHNIEIINGLIYKSPELVINDYKRHITAFNITRDSNTVFDIPINQYRGDLSNINNIITKILSGMIDTELKQWHTIRADAAEVYDYLEQRGVIYGYTRMFPRYDTGTYSGRSRTSIFNVQGLSTGDELYSIDGGDIYINFDWISFDLRMIAYLSSDETLKQAFADGDPYNKLASIINADNMGRDEVKRTILRVINNLEINNVIFDHFSNLRSWIISILDGLEVHGYTESILNRRFRVTKDRSYKSAFNATVQGSGAHAMQICLRRIWDIYPDNILTEIQDSIPMICRDIDEAKEIIDNVIRIMLRPFDGIIHSDMVFPVRVSLGRRYRQWKLYKNYGV